MSTHTTVRNWSIAGSAGETIYGNSHEPTEPPRGVVLLLHGFLGYKDYGLFPYLAERIAGFGWIAHRFNFSHSGMTNRIETFERPDLFERDTWNRQIEDVDAVLSAIDAGELVGCGLPYVLYGHSRGGVTALLAAGRRFRSGAGGLPAGVITAAAPDFTNRFDEAQQADLLQRGFVEVVSNRTQQTLRVGRAFLAEQLDDPAGHDLRAHIAALACPVLIVHGSVDATVPPRCAKALAAAVNVDKASPEMLFVPHGDHVFNTPNPMPDDAPPSRQLTAVIEGIEAFLTRVIPPAAVTP